VDVQRALKYLPGVLATGIEIMVPQDEFRSRVGIGANPGADRGGIVQDVLKTALPGFFPLSGVQQGLEAVEYGGFNAVANAANFPLAALVSGRKTSRETRREDGPVTRLSSKRRMAAAMFLSVLFIVITCF
jgi:hypothetical protein